MSLEKILPDLHDDVKDKRKHKYTLILHNDDVNLFEHIIESLVDVCDHNAEQAEQCALLAHLKGRCDVKHGEYSTLAPMQDGLSIRGITATIEL